MAVLSTWCNGASSLESSAVDCLRIVRAALIADLHVRWAEFVMRDTRAYAGRPLCVETKRIWFEPLNASSQAILDKGKDIILQAVHLWEDEMAAGVPGGILKGDAPSSAPASSAPAPKPSPEVPSFIPASRGESSVWLCSDFVSKASGL